MRRAAICGAARDGAGYMRGMNIPANTRPKPPPLSELTMPQRQWIFGGYLTQLGGLVGATIFLGQFNALVREEFGLSNGDFGLLFTVATIAAAIAVIFAGGLADRLQPRRLAVACLAAQAVLTFGYGQAPSVIWLGICIFGLRFLGQGMLPHIAFTLMARWFDRFRGRAISFVQLGFNTGEATFPFLLALAIAHFEWRNLFTAAACIIGFIILPLVMWCFRHAPRVGEGRGEGQARVGGGTAAASPAAAPAAVTGQQWTRGRVLRNPLFLLLMVATIVPPIFLTVLLFFQANLVSVKGWDLLTYTAMFPVMTASGVTAAIITGQLVDRLGAYRMVPLMVAPLIVASLLIGYVDTPWMVPLIFAFVGMSTGFGGPMIGSLWAELYGTANLGAIRALAQAAIVVGAGIGPGLSGYLLDLGMTIPDQAPWFAGICVMLTCILLLARGRIARLAALRGAPG